MGMDNCERDTPALGISSVSHRICWSMTPSDVRQFARNSFRAESAVDTLKARDANILE